MAIQAIVTTSIGSTNDLFLRANGVLDFLVDFLAGMYFPFSISTILNAYD